MISRRFLFFFAALSVLSCTAHNPEFPATVEKPTSPSESDNGLISAEKASWVVATKSNDDRAFAKDIPWAEGDKVLLLNSKYSLEGCHIFDDTGNYVIQPVWNVCTVSKAAGLKCTLIPDKPLEEGTYRAFYPVYEYAWYDYLHLSFLYEDWNELDWKHQDIVVSDPVKYKGGSKISFVMKHICGLIDIDIYPPKNGTYTHLKLFAQTPVFPGKAELFLDKEYNAKDSASGWLNFTTLRGEGRNLKMAEVFPTSTGLLPIQYAGLPVCIHLVYADGTHYVSAPLAMPSLKFGEAMKLVAKDFTETDTPMQGLWGEYYDDPSGTTYPVH